MSQADASLPGTSRLTFHALAAEHGDCVVLSYGDERHDYRVVVDAGVEGTADRLRKVLNDSPDAVWELLVVSHIDADHIGGVLALLTDKAIAGRFQDIWFNGRQHLDPPGTESLGVVQGIELQRTLADDGISWNRAFGQKAVCLDSGVPVKKVFPSGALVTVLSPSTQTLAGLRGLWERYLRAAEATREAKPQNNKRAPPGLESMGGDVMDIRGLAATSTTLDGSVTNASSIALLFEFGGKRILLGADAHPNVLVASSAHLDVAARIGIDVFKLPHHGSSKNVTESLVKAYPASRYVVSTNGAYHNHPDDVAIARVLQCKPDAQLLFNYPCGAYERWQYQAGLPASKFTIVAGEGNKGISIQLL